MSERVVVVGESAPALVEEENGLVVAVEANVQAAAGNVLEVGAGNVLEVVVNERAEEEIERAVVVDAACAWEGMALKLEASDSTATGLCIWICCNRQAC